MKDYGLYKPSYDVVPDGSRQRKEHALKIIYKASKVLYKQAKRGNYPDMIEVSDFIFEDISSDEETVFEQHSGVEGVDVDCTEITSKYQTMRFADEHCEGHFNMDVSFDETRKIRDMPDVSLNDFASRPVLIHSQRWNYADEFESGEIDPWSAVMLNKRVANRLTNYNLFRAKLRIKIVLTGNPFLYGRAIAFYYPFLRGNEGLIDPTRRVITRTQQSQLPHIYLDPSSSEAGEMTLPFFFFQDYVSLPDGEINRLGRLHINSITPLRHVNEAPGSFCELQVFAWFEDVQVAAPTQRDLPFLTAQSGEEVDEANSKGVISGPATAIARAAQILSGVSSIAPYAMATEKVANTTAAVAKHFGFSAPPVTKAVEPMRPSAFAQLANTTVPATLNKLALDDKQELSIDPRIAGLGSDDPLNIHNIASREAYVCSIAWTSDQPRGDNLFSALVTPTLYNRSIPTGEIALTPVGMATLPFKYWTGSLRFRVMICSSSLHKGRMLIQHDPRDAASVPLEGVEYNTTYSKVVDISKQRDFTIEIGNTQETTYLETLYPERRARTEFWRSDGIIVPNHRLQNGTLNFYVLNPLTAPGDAVQQVHILIFVSAGRDFEVAVPNPHRLNDYDRVVYEPQSGSEEASKPAFEFIANEDMAPQMYEIDEFSSKIQNLKNINKVYFGETVTSFRTIIKRFTKVEQGQLAASPPADHKITRGLYPLTKGNYATAPNTSEIGNYAYANMTVINWLMMSFAGVRGGMRWKVLFEPFQGESNGFVAYATNDVEDEGNYYRNVSTEIPLARYDENGVDMFSTGITARMRNLSSGGVLVHSQVNPVLEFEVPFYSNRRFWSTGTTIEELGAIDTGWEAGCEMLTAPNLLYKTWCAAAEDFQLFFWTGLPNLIPRFTLPVQV